jgi:hypothetical protein
LFFHKGLVHSAQHHLNIVFKMANPEHLEILKKGSSVWNEWRDENDETLPNLKQANLHLANLNEANLEGADLTGAKLTGAFLNLANLSRANLERADLTGAFLNEANLTGAKLTGAFLNWANLSGADLEWADLYGANLYGAIIEKVRFMNVTVGYTVFSDIDLSSIEGIDTIHHVSPSEISISTLYKSKANIPDIFLRGCGAPDNFINYVHSLKGKAFDFYRCFISYSIKDQLFAERLHDDLEDNGVMCWLAGKDLEGGKYNVDQINKAIRTHEKFLLILSENSIESEWVKTEIIIAKEHEDKEGKVVLFPIRLLDFEKIREWEFFDSDTGRDLARDIRKFYIPSFKGCEKDNDAYQKEFDRLLDSLKKERGE